MNKVSSLTDSLAEFSLNSPVVESSSAQAVVVASASTGVLKGSDGQNLSITSSRSHIFSSSGRALAVSAFLSCLELGRLCQVSKTTKGNIDKKVIWDKALYKECDSFGPERWAYHFERKVDDVPQLPPDTFADKAWVKNFMKSHILQLMPATLDNEPLTPNLIEKLTLHPKQGHAIGYRYFSKIARDEYGNKPIASKSYWVWVTKGLLDGSRNKSPEAMEAIALEKGYQLMNAGVAIVCNLTHYVKTEERLYGDKPLTYTYTSDKTSAGYRLVVGGFSPAGLDVYDGDDFVDEYYGVAGQRPCGSSVAIGS
jgi:hypothetical protein